jgi:hypothetical protein
VYCYKGHAVVVHDSYVYVLGGCSESRRFNDCWRSRDCGTYAFGFKVSDDVKLIVLSAMDTYLFIL